MSLVVLTRYLSLSEAHIAAGALRSAGLNPTVFDVMSGSVMPLQQMYLGGYRIVVPEEEIAAGFEVLKLDHVDPPEFEEDLEDESSTMRTPRWGFGWTVLAVALGTLTWALGFTTGAYGLVVARRKPTPFWIAALVLLALLNAFFWGILIHWLMDRNAHTAEVG